MTPQLKRVGLFNRPFTNGLSQIFVGFKGIRVFSPSLIWGKEMRLEGEIDKKGQPIDFL
jgi:hypothetical protein